MGLGRVLDHRQAEALSQPPDRVHVTELPVEMDRHDGGGSLGNGGGGRFHVDQAVRVADVAEDRGRAGVDDGEGGGDESHPGHDDLVAGADAGRP